jgi:ferredoxin-NADP reductase
MNAPLPHGALLEDSVSGQPRKLLVRAIRMQAEGIHAFELVHPDGDELPPVQAGAHVDVHLPGGVIRSYSLAGDPLDRSCWTLGVLRESNGRGGSQAMHESVRVGAPLTVGWPRNVFTLADTAKHTVLLAGGIGITPLKAMAHVLASRGDSFELHYCARTVKHAAFLSELAAIVPPGHLHLHHDGGDASKSFDIAGLLANPEPDTHVYFCGPTGFMKACEQATRHWSEGTVHSEHFKAPDRPTSTEIPAGSFEVKLARSGGSVVVAPDQTIVRALELAGHRIPTSCLSGLCGTCKVGYLEGEVDHQDYILSDEEKKYCMTACVSRATSSCLVLDI